MNALVCAILFAFIFGDAYVYAFDSVDAESENEGFYQASMDDGDGYDDTYDGAYGTDGGESSASLQAALNVAMEALEAAKSNASPGVIDHLTQNVENARNAFESYCSTNGIPYTVDVHTGYVSVSRPEFPSNRIGDPVILSCGTFVIDDSDIDVHAGCCSYVLERNYRSDANKPEYKQGGAFGSGWTCSIDTRIIPCFDQNDAAEYSKWESFLADESRYGDEISDCVNDNSECQTQMDEYNKLMDEYKAEVEKFRIRKENSSAAEAAGALVLYGAPGYAARTLGMDSLLFVSDRGFMELCTLDCENIFRPIKKQSPIEKITIDRETKDYTVYFTDGALRTYNEKGIIESITARNGSVISFEKNHDTGKITSVCVNNTRKLTLSWNNDRLQSVSDGIRSAYYSYEAGLLSIITDNAGYKRSFKYDSNGVISEQIKADGSKIEFKFTSKDGNGNCKMFLTLNENGYADVISYKDTEKKTQYTDHNGNDYYYWYNDQGNLITNTTPLNRLHSYEYDEAGNLKTRYISAGPIDYTYDALGNCTMEQYPDGTFVSRTFNGSDMMTSSDRDGIVTSYSYDEKGNCTSKSIGSKRMFYAEYNSDSLVRKNTDCRENCISYEYDNMKDCIKRIHYSSENGLSVSFTETYAYDPIGRIKRHTLAGKDIQRTTEWKYTPSTVTVTNANKLQTTYTYSPRGDIVSREQKDTETGETRTMLYTYDYCHNCISVDSIGSESPGEKQHVCSYSYMPEGQICKKIIWNTGLHSQKNPNEPESWVYEYSWNGNVLKQVTYGAADKSGNLLSGSLTCTFTEKIESYGKSTVFCNADGRRIEKQFDESGNLLLEKDTDFVRKLNAYTPAGRMKSFKKTDGGIIDIDCDCDAGMISEIAEDGMMYGSDKFEYYADGKLKKTIKKDGTVSLIAYNEYGLVKEITNNNRTILYTYDGTGRVTSKKCCSPEGKEISSVTYKYNDSTDVTTITNEKGTFECKMNPWGEVTQIKDNCGGITNKKYDTLGRCVLQTLPCGLNTEYVYNGFNQVILESRSDGTFTSFEYDADGNLIRAADSCGDYYRAQYDRSGRVISESKRPFASPLEYIYDGLDRIISVTQSGKIIASYEYSADGKMISFKDAKGNKILYETDGFGRILSETDRLGSIRRYSYGRDGKLSSFTDFEGKKTSVEGSAEKGKYTSTDSCGEKTEFTYDAAVHIVKIKNNSGTTEYTYDTSGRLKTVTDQTTGDCIKYTYTDLGAVSGIQGGHRNIKYSYDTCGNVTAASDLLQNCTIRFEYDMYGRETVRQNMNGAEERKSYDSAGRIIGTSGFSGTKCVYAEGNMYDEKGYLTLSVSLDGSVIRYSYDMNGRLSAVLYPYTKSCASYYRHLWGECGLRIHEQPDEVKQLLLAENETTALQSQINKTTDNQGVTVNKNQQCLEELFTYDENGNMTSRKTPWGTILYTYDGNDRLISYGNGCTCSYDADGNLISENTLYNSKFYTYTETNRMKTSCVQNRIARTQTDVSYQYDAIGRRVQTAVAGRGARRTVYEGFSLKELYSTPFYTGEMMWSDQNASNDLSRTKNSSTIEESISGRYAWISDSEEYPEKETAVYESWDGISMPMYDMQQNPVILECTASTSDSKKSLFLVSSVRNSIAACMQNSEITTCTYDAFGSVIENKFPIMQPYGYNGKYADHSSALLNYGFRDYDSRKGRFTTSDPIKSGFNWYAYCDSDPVNYVDKWGLSITSMEDMDMHDEKWADAQLGNSKTETIDDYGCAVTAVAEMLNSIFEVEEYTPSDVNSMKALFDNGTGNINFQSVANQFGLSIDVFGFTDYGFLNDILDQLDASSAAYALVAQVIVDSSSKDGTHFVGINTGTKEINGRTYVEISATSKYDGVKNLSTTRQEEGWLIKDGRTYIPVSCIVKIEALKNR